MIMIMNYKKAHDILEIEIDPNDKIECKHDGMTFLKKRYHKLALQNHPDKNGNTIESNNKFQQIKEAYEYLEEYLKQYKNSGMNYQSTATAATESSIYTDILNMFLASVLDGKYTDILSSIIQKIINTDVTTRISIKLFEDLDKETSIRLYSLLSKYQSVLRISDDLLNQVRAIVIEKCNNTIVYTLNPSIDDLLDNNVYQLYVDEQLYLVPLWHCELYFEGTTATDTTTTATATATATATNEPREIIVLCEPQLPNGVTIDEDNNLYIEQTILLSDLMMLDEPSICVLIGKKILEIPKCELHVQREQVYKFKGVGITKIKNDICDISDKADIIVKLCVCG